MQLSCGCPPSYLILFNTSSVENWNNRFRPTAVHTSLSWPVYPACVCYHLCSLIFSLPSRLKGGYHDAHGRCSLLLSLGGSPAMPTAAGFAALFEVAAMSVALTIACIGGCRYTARCLRSSSPMHLSGLTASLLTVFFCIYGELHFRLLQCSLDYITAVLVSSSQFFVRLVVGP